MHELTLTTHDKVGIYRQITPQIAALLADETDPIANLANTVAVLKEAFNWLWVGFYRVDGNELVLSAFQGPLACTRIAHGRGVCGQAWAQNQTLVIADVLVHPDHIACSSRSRSEIVVPLHAPGGKVCAVLDVDAETTGSFDNDDAQGLEKIAALVANRCFS